MPVQSKETLTLKQLSERVRLNEKLSAHARSEMCSAINTFARVCGRDASIILADPQAIRGLAKVAAWQLHKISKGSWANTLSRLTRALDSEGVAVHRRRRNLKLNTAWEALLAPLPRPDRDALHRFAGWCSVRDIGPHDVSVEAFDAYLAYLSEQSILDNPRERYNVARRAWNKAIAVPGSQYVEVPINGVPAWRGLDWSAFPETLRKDIADYRAYKLKVDPFGKKPLTGDGLWKKRRKPLKKVTVDGYLSSLRQSASRLIEKGAPIEGFAKLSAFVEIDTVREGLSALLGARELDEARPALHALMTAVLSIASFLQIQGEHLAELKELADEARYRPMGMCERNKTRLQPFESEKVMHRFVQLPSEVAKRLENVKSPSSLQALLMQMAVLLELLLHIPLRVQNAATLRLDRHFQFPVGGGPGGWRLSIPKGEVKNDKAIDVEFSEATSMFFARYVTVFRPVLTDGQSSALFVGRSGEQKGPSALAKQFKKFIRRELGLQVNAHLMRHLMAFAYLKAHPGHYESVRQLLGHKQIETTIKFYAGSEEKAAFRRLDAVIDFLRNGDAPHCAGDHEAIGDLEHIL